MIALSPDGAQIAYVANTRLYLRSMSELDVHAIQGTERYQDVTDPVFSPDGRSIAFYAAADQTLKKIATTGGVAVTICPADAPLGITWGPDGIVFGQRYKGIMRVSPNGGTADVLVSVKDGEEPHRPQLLPGGQHVLFTLATGTAADRWEKARIVVQSVASGERKTLIEGGSDARYVPTGHLVYAVGGSLFAVAFDLQRLEVRGGPVPMVEGVRRSSGRVTGAAHFSLSSTGSLIYIPGPVSASSAPMELAVIDRKGEVERLKLPPGPYCCPARLQTAHVSPLGPMTAKKRSSGSMTCPVGARAGDSRTEGTTAFRSGPRTVNVSRFSPIARATWPSSGSPPPGAPPSGSRSPNKANRMSPESWSPKGDRLLFSVTKGSDVSLRTFSLQDRKATPFGEVHSAVSRRRPVLAQWAMGSLRKHGTRHDDDLRRTISSHGGQVSAVGEGARKPT